MFLPPVVECSTCGKRIVWVQTENGKRAPCDARMLTITTPEGKTVRGWESHFATCRDAELHRKSKAAAPDGVS